MPNYHHLRAISCLPDHFLASLKKTKYNRNALIYSVYHALYGDFNVFQSGVNWPVKRLCNPQGVEMPSALNLPAACRIQFGATAECNSALRSPGPIRAAARIQTNSVTKFSARRRKRHARGVPSPAQRSPGFNFGGRTKPLPGHEVPTMQVTWRSGRESLFLNAEDAEVFAEDRGKGALRPLREPLRPLRLSGNPRPARAPRR